MSGKKKRLKERNAKKKVKIDIWLVFSFLYYILENFANNSQSTLKTIKFTY